MGEKKWLVIVRDAKSGTMWVDGPFFNSMEAANERAHRIMELNAAYEVVLDYIKD